MNKPFKWIAILLVLALLAGCGDAGNYIKENYSLVDVTGQGKNTAKIYQVEGKDVPTVAKELADKEKPQEISKESQDRMFLVYDNKIINVQKDPNNEGKHAGGAGFDRVREGELRFFFPSRLYYGFALQSLFGGGWFNSNHGGYDYRGYNTSQRYNDYGKYQSGPKPSTGTTPSQPAPTTTDRKGDFTTKPGSGTTSSPSSSSDSGSVRRSDGSTPTYKSPSSSSTGSKPKTSTRSGSFKRK
ncbi:DUF4247 domain-containing protein [Paenibacillus sp. P26]|nr:DUF4247 domain-containing protein [Paenibacillus sp. P26]